MNIEKRSYSNRGYRLVAMSQLPIDKLVYGSNDCGSTIHCEDEQLKVLMQDAAKVYFSFVTCSNICSVLI